MRITKCIVAVAEVIIPQTLNLELLLITQIIIKKMDTNDPALEFFRLELREIKSRKFHIFRPISDADFDYCYLGKMVSLGQATMASGSIIPADLQFHINYENIQIYC